MNINMVNLPVNVLQSGDELAVFDGTTCVGAITVVSHHLLNQTASIAVSGKDYQGMPGFTAGNPITLKLWNSKQNTEFILEPEIVKGTSTFAKNETTVASLEKYTATGLDGIAGNGLTEINCYPNPFRNEVTVEIKLSKDSEVEVEVLNQLGQRIRFLQTSKMLNSGVHRLMWDGRNAGNGEVSPGIYHLRIGIDNREIQKKIVLSK
jgi:flagellar hook assembly protein FlgD